MHTQEEIIDLVDLLPACDILLSHEGPEVAWENGVAHEGYKGINKYLKEKKPKLLIHGHRHKNRIYLCEGVLCVSIYKYATLDIENMRIDFVGAN